MQYLEEKCICQDIVDAVLCCIFFHRSFTQKTGLEAALRRSSPETEDEYIDLVDEYINLVDECNDNKRLWVEKLSYANCTLERIFRLAHLFFAVNDDEPVIVFAQHLSSCQIISW